ncbi:anion transporter [Desulfovibrio sp. X2]|uniref:SLC13 family permease n=1 Tax=Desulfovibrio sp. X2 TaxID=941449 RepID=UPI0003589B0D|nr:DASS family sodium-coupled anion symporter [Desulfovibrio sp. X2]EPR43688.1 anion transporter [Desulfovibrio sp. X2]
MEGFPLQKRIGLFLGPVLFLLVLALPLPQGMSPAALKVAATTLLMATWWITEAIPIPATALIPIVLFPALGVMKSSASTTPYANHLIFLFMGGFFIAVTMEKWNLHRRVALHTIQLVGTTPSRVVLGFMLATGFLSMWVSNTATAMMMVPIGIAVIQQVTGFSTHDLLQACPTESAEANFGKCLMLGIAYAASIGGVATIIGTPPNTVMVGVVDKVYHQSIGFAQWMFVGVPLAAIMMVATWWLMTSFLFPMRGQTLGKGEDVIREEISKLGPMSKAEKWIVAVGLTVCTIWVTMGFIKIPLFKTVSDTTVGMAGALLLFCIPIDTKKGVFLLDWKTAVKIPWDVILLFGGGFALAGGFETSGLDKFVGEFLVGFSSLGLVGFSALVIACVIALTEVTSNTAVATLMMPIMASAAVAIKVHPYGPMFAACLASSMAFMLPVSTPPNAVVFGSGCVSIPQMAKTGMWMNLIAIILLTVFTVAVMPLVWGIDIHSVPSWAAGMTP